MKEKKLTKEAIEKIEELSEKGNDLFDKDNFNEAINVWQEALLLIPGNQNLYSESQWLHTSIGDALFYLGNYEKALLSFKKAKQNIENNAYGNPFIMLRLGQCYLENNLTKDATEYLLRAFMFEGEDIFEDDDEKYLNFLKKNVDLNKT